MLSHETAAEVHGLTDKPSAKIHITVPADRHPARHRPIRGVVIHRSSQSRPMRLPEWKLPRTRIEDTVLDLVAKARTFDEAYSWISRALSQKLVGVDTLREALRTRSRIRWRVWLAEALADAEEGAYFPLERRYARDVERARGLPKAQRQARRIIGGRTHYKDNWYPEYRVCVELDGPTYHQNERIQQDKRRDNLNLAVDAAQTYRFGPVEVTERACESAAMVAATLRRRGWQGQLHPCRRPGCKVGTPR
jgi:very-short-patch-repair endonuclease